MEPGTDGCEEGSATPEFHPRSVSLVLPLPSGSRPGGVGLGTTDDVREFRDRDSLEREGTDGDVLTNHF